jgi:hypothetical protein
MNKEKRSKGRPLTVFSPEQVELVEKLSAYLSVAQICDIMKIKVTTFERIRKRQPEIMEAYKSGKSKMLASIAQKGIIAPALSGNVKAAIFYLNTQGGENWRIRREDVSDEPQPVKIEFILPKE